MLSWTDALILGALVILFAGAQQVFWWLARILLVKAIARTIEEKLEELKGAVDRGKGRE